MCLGNISEEFAVYNTIKTGLNGYVYAFSVDYDIFDVIDFINIHKNLLKKLGIRLYLNFFKTQLIGLLRAGTTEIFGRSIVSNSKESIKYVS